MKKYAWVTLGVVGLGVLIYKTAAAVTLPYTFTAGLPIKASEVNANFSTIRDALNNDFNLSSSPSVDSITMNYQSVAPGTPASGTLKVYAKTDGNVYKINPSGIESILGSGGGGAGIVWNDEGPDAAIKQIEFNQTVYMFSPGVTQHLRFSFKVPRSYTAGTQIIMYLSHYSPASSGTILIQSTSYLVRKSTDPFSSTTNSMNSGNSALTNTSTNQLREATLPLTDSTGKINSVTVSPGDTINVDITRGTDTDTSDIRVVASGVDITS